MLSMGDVLKRVRKMYQKARKPMHKARPCMTDSAFCTMSSSYVCVQSGSCLRCYKSLSPLVDWQAVNVCDELGNLQASGQPAKSECHSNPPPMWSPRQAKRVVSDIPNSTLDGYHDEQSEEIASSIDDRDN